MKLDFITDLHLEFGPMELNPVGDVLVIAGDLHVGMAAIPFIDEALKVYDQVYYVLGNHEFYHHDYDNIVAWWLKAAKHRDNFEVLHNMTHAFDGVRFIGTTLWTYGRQYVINDFALIMKGKNLLTVDDTQGFHLEAVRFLEDALALPWGGETVVITHHAPIPECVTPRFVGNLANNMFHAELNELIADNEIKFWLHGHMHDSISIDYADTVIVCNPRGYIGHGRNNGFENPLTLEV